MRVTDHTNYDTIRDSIQRSKERLENFQMQSSTLKKLNTPSDNPIGAAKVLEVRTDKVNNEQFLMNAKLAETFLENSEHALSELSELVMRAKEIAVNQSSGASANEDTRMGIAEEVAQLFSQAVAAGNRRIGDRFLFGGYKTHRPPISAEGQFQGDDGQMMVEVARDVFVSMNLPGIEAFNSRPKSSYDGQNVYGVPMNRSQQTVEGIEDPDDGVREENVNVFGELQNLHIGLLSGDTDAIRNTLERFDTILAKLVANRSMIGSRLQGLKSLGQSLERHTITNAQLTTQLEDADMAQVMSDLAREETILRSALSSSKHLIQPTLLDFLR